MRSWSRDAIIKAINNRVEKGCSIRGTNVAKEDKGLYIAAKRYFGKDGWAKARVLAGFLPVDPKPFQIWTEITVVETIQELFNEGVALHTGALQKSKYAYILSAGCKVFGTWKDAIEAAGLDYSTIRKGRQIQWTKNEIIAAIKNLEQRGVKLSLSSMRRSHGDLLGTAVLFYGCWSEAVEAAGISYRSHCQVWSTKAWLRRMKPEEYQALLLQTQKHSLQKRKPYNGGRKSYLRSKSS